MVYLQREILIVEVGVAAVLARTHSELAVTILVDNIVSIWHLGNRMVGRKMVGREISY